MPLDANSENLEKAAREDSKTAPKTDVGEGSSDLDSKELVTSNAQPIEQSDQPGVETSTDEDLQVAASYLLRLQQHQGPLPLPSTLRGYEEIVPGSAQRIVQWAEKEQEHRHQLERQVVDAHVASTRRDPLLGFVLVFSALLMGGYLMSNGHDLKGFAVFAGAIGTAAAMAVWNRRIRKDLEESEKKVKKED